MRRAWETGPSDSAPTIPPKENHAMTRHLLFRLLVNTRCLAAGALAVLGCILTPTAARAQFGLFGSGIVFDPGNFARNVLHYVRRLEQINLQRQQLQQQVAAMRKLRNANWGGSTGRRSPMGALRQDGQARGDIL